MKQHSTNKILEALKTHGLTLASASGYRKQEKESLSFLQWNGPSDLEFTTSNLSESQRSQSTRSAPKLGTDSTCRERGNVCSCLPELDHRKESHQNRWHINWWRLGMGWHKSVKPLWATDTEGACTFLKDFSPQTPLGTYCIPGRREGLCTEPTTTAGEGARKPSRPRPEDPGTQSIPETEAVLE